MLTLPYNPQMYQYQHMVRYYGREDFTCRTRSKIIYITFNISIPEAEPCAPVTQWFRVLAL